MEQVKEINWPAWCIALMPLVVAFPTYHPMSLWLIFAVNIALWLADVYLNRSYKIHFLTIIGLIILPPCYLWLRKMDIKSSISPFIASLIVIMVSILFFSR